jgi:hypothetical protein
MSGIFKPALNPHAYKQFKRICPRLNASYGEEAGTGYAAVATIVGPLDAHPTKDSVSTAIDGNLRGFIVNIYGLDSAF